MKAGHKTCKSIANFGPSWQYRYLIVLVFVLYFCCGTSVVVFNYQPTQRGVAQSGTKYDGGNPFATNNIKGLVI